MSWDQGISSGEVRAMMHQWYLWDRVTGRSLGRFEGELEDIMSQLEDDGHNICDIGAENDFNEWCREYGV